MARDGFRLTLHGLEETSIQMAACVEEAIARAVSAMMHADDLLAESVINEDAIVDGFCEKVHAQVLLVLERWAPVGAPLRRILTYQLIADELERIGDYAVHIARSSQLGYRTLPLDIMGDISEMARLVRQQVHDGVQALALADDEAARRIGSRDTTIDELYQHIFSALQDYIAHEPDMVRETTRLLFTMHDLERIADRISNICEDVIFIVTGTHVKLN